MIEVTEEKNYWWLSFADLNKPEGEQFLGATILRGNSLVEVTKEAWRREINPGGEIKGSMISPKDFLEIIEKYPEIDEYRGRLVGKEELIKEGHLQQWSGCYTISISG
jgi:hypothetical protein